jgi:acetylornithine aminotransferase
MSDHLMQTYARLPIAFSWGEGAWLWDEAGHAYLDAVSGIAVCGLGHAHPAVTEAIREQAGRLLHTSNLYRIPLQEELAARLCALSGLDRAFFCNSGAEANEAAIKLARRYAHDRGIANPSIIVMEGAFHGRTLATLTATGNRRVQAGFEPLVAGFVRAPYGDIEALRQIAAHQPGIVAILVEPIQGESGIRMPPAGYLRELRSLCDAQHWLLMLDEIQTGMGRSGQWFAYQREDIVPDVLTLAKGLGNGMPVGACLARGDAAQVFKPGNHGSTFGGNLLACRAALAVIETIHDDGLIANAELMGNALHAALVKQFAGMEGIREIRHQGLLFAIELERPCAELVRIALDERLLINVTQEKVIRLLPPLIINEAEVAAIAERLSRSLARFFETGG